MSLACSIMFLPNSRPPRTQERDEREYYRNFRGPLAPPPGTCVRGPRQRNLGAPDRCRGPTPVFDQFDLDHHVNTTYPLHRPCSTFVKAGMAEAGPSTQRRTRRKPTKHAARKAVRPFPTLPSLCASSPAHFKHVPCYLPCPFHGNEVVHVNGVLSHVFPSFATFCPCTS